jgi:hypothetical protein
MSIIQDAARIIETSFFLRCGFFQRAPVEMQVQKAKRARRAARNFNQADSDYGNIEELLSDLDRLFGVLVKLRMPIDDIRQMMTFGIFIAPASTPDWSVQIDRAMVKPFGLPGFIATSLAFDRDEDHVRQFWSAQKVSHPVGVEMSRNGTIYEFSMYAGSDNDDKVGRAINRCGRPLSFFVEICPDGRVRQLKHKERQGFGPMNGSRSNRPEHGESPRRWIHAPIITPDGIRVDPRRAESVAAMVFNLAMQREMNVNVVARDPKSGMKLVFCVPMHAWKDFFRVRAAAPGDLRRRMFHFVTGHSRDLKSGQSVVRVHTRGQRQFVWNGYEMTIVLPGRHGCSAAEFNLEASLVDAVEPGMLTPDQTGPSIERMLGHAS